MGQALRAAELGLGRTAPNPSVGAAIFDPVARTLLSLGTTQPGGRPHAEPVAIDAAGVRATGGTLAVTLEPCSHFGRSPPCVDAVLKANIKRVVYAQVDPDPRVAGRGIDRLRAAGVEVVACDRDQADAARLLTRGHILRVTERRPLVQLKLAVGADGRIAEARGGAPAWVTGLAARRHGHLLRAKADAILVGTGTVAADNPELTCRLPGLSSWSPIRIILGERNLDPNARLLTDRAGPPVLWFGSRFKTGDDAEVADTSFGASGAKSAPVSPAFLGREAQTVGGRIWLPGLMDVLVADGVTRLLVEGGPGLWRSFARAALADEVYLYHARKGSGQPVGEDHARAALHRYIPEVAATTGLRLVAQRAIASDDLFVFNWNGPGNAHGWVPSGQ